MNTTACNHRSTDNGREEVLLARNQSCEWAKVAQGLLPITATEAKLE